MSCPQGGVCEGRCGCACQNGAGCGGMWGGHKFHILRFLIALIIVGFVFSFGVHIGELKGAFGMGGGMYGRHSRMYGGNQFYSDGNFMMSAPQGTTFRMGVMPIQGGTITPSVPGAPSNK